MSMMNRIANTANRFQGQEKRVLCVCSAGLLRSPTTANVLHKKYGYNTRAVGVSQEYALIPIDVAHLHWADEIVCMEQEHMMAIDKLATDEGYSAPINFTVLDVPDRFGWMDEKLQELIGITYAESIEEQETEVE